MPHNLTERPWEAILEVHYCYQIQFYKAVKLKPFYSIVYEQKKLLMLLCRPSECAALLRDNRNSNCKRCRHEDACHPVLLMQLEPRGTECAQK